MWNSDKKGYFYVVLKVFFYVLPSLREQEVIDYNQIRLIEKKLFVCDTMEKIKWFVL